MKFLTFLLVAVSAALAQQPRITNARLEVHAANGGLEAEIHKLTAAAAGPEWAGYAVPMIPGEHQMCCWNSDRQCACTLEPEGGSSYGNRNVNGQTVKLEGPGTLVILFRIANHSIDKVRTFSIDCELDAGGLPMHWLTGITPSESLNYLASIAPVHKQAVMAIAMHADPGADAALERLAAPSLPEQIRKDVAFWLGSARGHRGVEILRQVLARDPSEHVRDQVAFAFSISKEPEATTFLIESAKNDPSPHVRGQALFWLAHKAGQKETAAISRAITDDPDTHVKKQAVFALHELPGGEGVPLLIQVARTNTNPEVRKQAMFWLGQTQDPRALKFFEEVLTK